MTNAVVFVGPSLDRDSASEVLKAKILPPIKRGDIAELLAMSSPPSHIGIVDGHFLQQMSISPKEILIAMDRGVHLYGSSSMGALRAVELAPYGMTGIGRIFALYQSGEVDGDDEVAITFDPETLSNLCEPLVNVRIAVADALAEGAISPLTANAIVKTGKAIYFPQRTYINILAAAKHQISKVESEDFMHFLRSRKPDAKRSDALDLLRRMKYDIAGEARCD